MYAVIMAGGKGERLWPKSTKGKAKHVLSFGTRNAMIQETIKRLRQNIPIENIFLVTTKKQYPTLKAYVSNLKRNNVILEPQGKDTAAAICLSALKLKKKFGNVPMVVVPADHIIKNTKTFFKDIMLAEKIASNGSNIVIIGKKPKYASIGYGYIETGRKYKRYREVKRFTEKPKKKKAEKLYKKKNYFWNSGIFVWRVDSVLEAFKKHMPDLYYGLDDSVRLENKKNYSVKLSMEYARLKPLSIDYGIMEPISENRSQKIFCIEGGFDWVDIGSWSSLEEIYNKDKKGNIALSNSVLMDVKGSIVMGEKFHKIGVIGVRDLIIIQTKSGTLICKKDRAQDVKELVRSFA